MHGAQQTSTDLRDRQLRGLLLCLTGNTLPQPRVAVSFSSCQDVVLSEAATGQQVAEQTHLRPGSVHQAGSDGLQSLSSPLPVGVGCSVGCQE